MKILRMVDLLMFMSSWVKYYNWRQLLIEWMVIIRSLGKALSILTLCVRWVVGHLQPLCFGTVLHIRLQYSVLVLDTLLISVIIVWAFLPIFSWALCNSLHVQSVIVKLHVSIIACVLDNGCLICIVIIRLKWLTIGRLVVNRGWLSKGNIFGNLAF